MLRTRPFFIVGNPRSGTTLLRTLLCGHSNLFIPDETGFLAHLEEFQSRELSQSEIERLVDQIGRMNHEWFNLVDDLDRFCDALPKRRLEHVLDGLYRIKTGAGVDHRWGDKGPSYVRVMPKIDRVFPDAQFIHIIRDGRDCVVSALKKWGDRYWYYDAYYLLKTWQRNVTLGQEAGRLLDDDRYLEIRYEQLVENTEQTVRKVCDFLDEPFEPAMLDHTGMGQQISAPTGHHEVSKPVTPGSIDNWRSKMTEFDQKLSSRLIGEELSQLGYEIPRQPTMTIPEHLRMVTLASRFGLIDSARRLLFASGWLTMSREKSRGRSGATSQST